jgi:hypothetical protein
MVEVFFIIARPPHGNDSDVFSPVRVYAAPQSVAKTSNNAIPFLILESSDKDNPVGVNPHSLGFGEINPMLSFVRMTLFIIEREGHSGIIPIPCRASNDYFL